MDKHHLRHQTDFRQAFWSLASRTTPAGPLSETTQHLRQTQGSEENERQDTHTHIPCRD